MSSAAAAAAAEAAGADTGPGNLELFDGTPSGEMGESDALSRSLAATDARRNALIWSPESDDATLVTEILGGTVVAIE